MATVNSFAVTVAITYGAVSTNPVNGTGFQAIAPWGKTSVRATPREALNDIFDKAGDMQGGFMGAYFQSQTLNGATGSGPTGFTNANEL